MKILNDYNSCLTDIYQEKIQKIFKHDIEYIFINNKKNLTIKCKNPSDNPDNPIARHYWRSRLLILNCPKYIINLISSNDINKITLGLNLL